MSRCIPGLCVWRASPAESDAPGGASRGTRRDRDAIPCQSQPRPPQGPPLSAGAFASNTCSRHPWAWLRTSCPSPPPTLYPITRPPPPTQPPLLQVSMRGLGDIIVPASLRPTTCVLKSCTVPAASTLRGVCACACVGCVGGVLQPQGPCELCGWRTCGYLCGWLGRKPGLGGEGD